MGGRRRLPAGKPRLLSRHDGWRGIAYGRAYADMVSEFGEPASGLIRFEYGRVALAQVNLLEASRALDAARWTRTHGKGRKPSAARLERLQRRQALQDQSYSQALDRVRALAKANGHGPDLAALLAALPDAGAR
jgi:hypothetical protein